MTLALFWYTNIFLAILVIAIAGKLFQKINGSYKDVPIAVQLEELLTIPFHLVAFIALYAYLENEPIFSAVFWQAYVVISLLIQVTSYFLPKQAFFRDKLARGTYLSVNIVAVLPLLPLYYMLVHYSFINFPGGL